MSNLTGTFNAAEAQALNNALSDAVLARDPAAVRRALAAGGDPSATSPGGASLAEEIVYGHPFPDLETELEFQERERECLQLLLDHGATLDKPAKKEIYESHVWLAPAVPEVRQALDFDKAGMRRDMTEVRSFLDQGLHPDTAAHWGGNAALLYATTYNNLPLMDLLLRAGADVNLVSPVCGKTPLLQATIYGHKEAFQKLVEWGADPEIKFKPGTIQGTVQDFAESSETPGMAAFVEELLKQRAWDLEHPKPPDVTIRQPITVAKPFKFKA
jgi:hypothetical protein